LVTKRLLPALANPRGSTHGADLTSHACIKAIEVSEKQHCCDLKTTFHLDFSFQLKFFLSQIIIYAKVKMYFYKE
jgi:hypothetical protein